jgi:hypothetical protein
MQDKDATVQMTWASLTTPPAHSALRPLWLRQALSAAQRRCSNGSSASLQESFQSWLSVSKVPCNVLSLAVARRIQDASPGDRG